MKCCSICGLSKPLSQFYSDKSKRGGYRNDCKACTNERTKRYAVLYKGTERGRSKVNELKKSWAQRARDELRDYYIRKKLTDGTDIDPASIPSELISAKRLVMQINRSLREEGGWMEDGW